MNPVFKKDYENINKIVNEFYVIMGDLQERDKVIPETSKHEGYILKGKLIKNMLAHDFYEERGENGVIFHQCFFLSGSEIRKGLVFNTFEEAKTKVDKMKSRDIHVQTYGIENIRIKKVKITTEIEDT